jgi:hypothetical protein
MDRILILQPSPDLKSDQGLRSSEDALFLVLPSSPCFNLDGEMTGILNATPMAPVVSSSGDIEKAY